MADHIRTVPDFPTEGIQFRDLTPLMADAQGLAEAVALLADTIRPLQPDLVAGMEARGFIFGTAVAIACGCGFVPLRKPGKLPVETLSADYALEYAEARLEIDPTLIPSDARVVLVDDLIATGGTALAAADLVRRASGRVVGAHFVIDLPDLGGADALRAHGVETGALLSYPGD